MTPFTKALVGTVAAGAMAISAAAPAMANDRGGISTGEVIAGALVLGGIAAVIASSRNNNNSDYRYDRAGYDGYDNRYGGQYGGQNSYYDNGRGWGGNPRQAIAMCVRTAERQASRYSYGNADVTDIRDVRRTRWGYEVRGRIAVNSNGRGWRHGDSNYGQGWGGDYRGWNSNHRGYDSGSFECRVERGRVVDIDFDGIDRL